MSEPKRHHTLPQFYMERFAVDGRVDVVDRDDPAKFFNAKPRNVLREKHFYSVETDDGRDASLEKMFATQVEGPAAAAFKRVFDDGYSLDAPGRRAAISLFLAFQCVRGPGTRRDLVQQHETAAKAIAEFATPESLRSHLEKRGETITDEQMADVAKYAHLGQYELMAERAAELHLDILVKHALEMVPFIARRTWVVLEFGAPLLLTSDEPVGYVGQDIDEPGDAQGVAGSPQLVFPIDPCRALLMIRPDMPAESGRIMADRRSADVVNRHVAFNATRSLVRRPGTDPLAGLTVPTKAPASFSIGNMILFQPFSSEKARARVRAQVERGEMPFRAFPFDLTPPKRGET
ncbi:MAG TPA: DUF4238 domain-containing protein [Polyangia bacterium]|nr:DUF4238 domain-containing protein [Polyangia bacterium]